MLVMVLIIIMKLISDYEEDVHNDHLTSSMIIMSMVLSREWMGMGVAGMICLKVIVEHSHPFPTFSTSVIMLMIMIINRRLSS